MNKKQIATTVIITLILIQAKIMLTTNAAAQPSSSELLYIDFANQDESLKHLDDTTEIYDGGLSTGDVGAIIVSTVDFTNGYLVFYGDNTGATSSTGYDEPIVSIKGYNEADGWTSHANLPYNYTVNVDFMVPTTPGHGNFYVLPRYKDVNNKYEVVVDTEYSNLVLNRVIGGSWTKIDTVPIGTPIATDTWYTLKVIVLWEYDSILGAYVNHFHVELYQGNTLLKSTDFYDTDVNNALDPSQYNGLAFLGFDFDNQFKVYMDNLHIVWSALKIGTEPDESSVSGWGGSDLDVTSINVSADNDLFIKLDLANQVSVDTANIKYWVIELDIDKDSRNSLTSFDYEYSVIIRIETDGSARADLYDSTGTWLTQIHIIGGGIGQTYFVVEVPTNSIPGLGDSLYVYCYTQLGGTLEDGVPRDDTGNGYSGEYYIWYLALPHPTSSWSTQSDATGDATPGSLDIIEIGSAYDDNNMYFRLNVSSNIAWYGGSSTGIYRIFVDADQDTATGYPINGLGADYMVEFVVGYVPKLYSYSGSNGEWGWTLIKGVDYLYNPGGDTSIIFYVPKTDFSDVPLANEIYITGNTGQGSSTIDSIGNLAVPVPEPWLTSVVVGVVLLLISLRLLNNK